MPQSAPYQQPTRSQYRRYRSLRESISQIRRWLGGINHQYRRSARGGVNPRLAVVRTTTHKPSRIEHQQSITKREQPMLRRSRNPDLSGNNQSSISQIRRGRANAPICPICLFLRVLVASWQEFALYSCKAPSTNRPFVRKTNPIPKTPKSIQLPIKQRVTPIFRSAGIEKTNPNKPNSRTRIRRFLSP